MIDHLRTIAFFFTQASVLACSQPLYRFHRLYRGRLLDYGYCRHVFHSLLLPQGGTRAFSPSDCLALLDAWWFHRAMNCRAKRSHPTLMCKILIDLAGAFRKRWFLLDVLIVGVDWTFMAATIGADSAKVVQLRYFNWFEFILIILDSIFVRVFMIFIYLHAFARGGRWRSAGGERRGIWFGTSWEGDSRRSHFAYLAAPAAHEIEVQSSGLGLAFQVGSSWSTSQRVNLLLTPYNLVLTLLLTLLLTPCFVVNQIKCQQIVSYARHDHGTILPGRERERERQLFSYLPLK